MCFRCGGAWHTGACKGESEWKSEQRLRYLLIARCIKCQAPISKNGACKHMTCTRCNAEFCWICRKNYKGHKKLSGADIIWKLGCNDLNGDTACQWLCIMISMFLILPFYTIYISGLKVGLFLNWLCIDSISGSTIEKPIV